MIYDDLLGWDHTDDTYLLNHPNIVFASLVEYSSSSICWVVFMGGKPQLINYKVRPPNNKFVYKFINPLTDHGYNPHQPLALGLICTNLANKSI